MFLKVILFFGVAITMTSILLAIIVGICLVAIKISKKI